MEKYTKYDKFTKEEVIEMLERERKNKEFWRNCLKDAKYEYDELASCYEELIKSGTTKPFSLKVENTLKEHGFVYDVETHEYQAMFIVEDEEETEKDIYLRDILWVVGGETPIDLWMDGDEFSFMSVETPYLNGICLIPEAFMGMEVVNLTTMLSNEDDDKCSRLCITLRK